MGIQRRRTVLPNTEQCIEMTEFNYLLPERIKVGIRDKTIPTPARLYQHSNTCIVAECDANSFDFEKQTKNAQLLKQVLLENETDFHYISYANFPRVNGRGRRFVVTTTNNSLIWCKYATFSGQSDQNEVYVAGMRLHLSTFLRLTQTQQRTLLSNNRALVELVFDKNTLKHINNDV